MASICCSQNIESQNPAQLKYELIVNRHKERNARITAMVLGFLALALFTCASVLLGLGSLGPNYFGGLGMFPYLGGVILSFVSVALICGALLFVAIYSVRKCQKERILKGLDETE